MSFSLTLAQDWAQLIDLAITRREVHIEQLQLFVSGALRHPALVNKDGSSTCLASPSPPTTKRGTAHTPSSYTHLHAIYCMRTHLFFFLLAARHMRSSQTELAGLLAHISRVRRDGILIVEGVVQWRKALVASDPDGMSLVAAAEGSTSSAAAAAFAPFFWRGADYLSKMLHDTDFLAELGVAPRMLELSAETLRFNPLFAPNTLSNAVRMPPLPSVAEHLIDRCGSFFTLQPCAPLFV